MKNSGGPSTGLQAKLPKLVITKFNGTFQDWPRFWGQFSASIDKSSIASVTKFSYLRELLAPKPRMSIEALPFSAEGYNRAVAILKDEYGKDSEIVKAYNKEILELPVTSDVDVKEIHQFHERLAYCVQSLETMGKLDQVNGNLSMTFDKLPGIRGDLVRTDDSWESWDFVKHYNCGLCETRLTPFQLRKWIPNLLVGSGKGLTSCSPQNKGISNSRNVFTVRSHLMFPGSAQRHQHLMKGRSFWLNVTFALIVQTVAIRPPNAGTNTRAVTVVVAITLPSAIEGNHRKKSH